MHTFHVPAVPHTRPTAAFSHCAFTTKTRLLPQLLAKAYPGCEIVYYGIGTDCPAGATRCVTVMDESTWALLFRQQREFVGDPAHVDHPGYRAFNNVLETAWAFAVKPGDVVCFPFGRAHEGAWPAAAERGALGVETGIGYPAPFLPFRIYESDAWLHYVAGLERAAGHDYHFTIPASFDLAEWPNAAPVHRRAKRLVYMGRLVETKGLAILRAVADAMPDVEIHCYGEGSLEGFASKNLVHMGVARGVQRARIFAEASGAIFPTRYIEPFCQAHIEALLCGTPVIASPFGVFPETAISFTDSYLGCPVFLARTLGEWVAGAEDTLGAEWSHERRARLADTARSRWGLDAVVPLYRYALDQMLATLTPAGWYGPHHPSRSETAA